MNETNELIARIRRTAGWTVDKGKGGHYKATAPSGKVITIASTPSDRHAIPNTKALLKKEGLFEKEAKVAVNSTPDLVALEEAITTSLVNYLTAPKLAAFTMQDVMDDPAVARAAEAAGYDRADLNLRVINIAKRKHYQRDLFKAVKSDDPKFKSTLRVKKPRNSLLLFPKGLAAPEGYDLFPFGLDSSELRQRSQEQSRASAVGRTLRKDQRLIKVNVVARDMLEKMISSGLPFTLADVATATCVQDAMLCHEVTRDELNRELHHIASRERYSDQIFKAVEVSSPHQPLTAEHSNHALQLFPVGCEAPDGYTLVPYRLENKAIPAYLEALSPEVTKGAVPEVRVKPELPEPPLDVKQALTQDERVVTLLAANHALLSTVEALTTALAETSRALRVQAGISNTVLLDDAQ